MIGALPSATVRVRVPAKINLHLGVGDLREESPVIYQEAMGTILVATPDATTARAQIAAGTSVEVRSIRTVGKDDKVGLMTCEGSISVKVPAGVATDAAGNATRVT